MGVVELDELNGDVSVKAWLIVALVVCCIMVPLAAIFLADIK